MSIKSRLIEGTSELLSTPARMKANSAKIKADAFVKNRKMLRQMKNVPDSGGESLPNGMPDTLFRARMNDISTTADYEREYAKRMGKK